MEHGKQELVAEVAQEEQEQGGASHCQTVTPWTGRLLPHLGPTAQ